MRFGILAGLAAFALLVMTGSAAADSVKADALFNEGRDLLEAGKFKAACQKFEDSLREADALGTRMNLALCMEKRGKVHSAVIKFDDAAQRAERENQADAALVAREHATALRPLIPKLTVKVTNRVPGQRVVVTRPGQPDVEIGDAALDVDPTDPSDPEDRVVVRATAPGYTGYDSEPLTVAVRATPTVSIPELTKIPDSIERPLPGPVRSKRKLGGILIGSAGLALMGGSTLWAYTIYKDVDRQCEDGLPPGCGYRTEGQYNTMRYVVPSIFVAGAAAVGIGIYMFVTAPKSGESSERTAVVPTISPDGAGLSVLGHF